MTQTEYIALLFNDCGYDTVAQRKAWLQKRFGKSFADELGSRERSLAMTELKDQKSAQQSRGYEGETPNA